MNDLVLALLAWLIFAVAFTGAILGWREAERENIRLKRNLAAWKDEDQRQIDDWDGTTERRKADRRRDG